MGFNPSFGSLNRIEYVKQVITIDPLGSIDLDDGFSFSSDEINYYLDIHIADPVSYFDFSNPLMIQIFKEFITRINTCYIPNSKGSNHAIHLLPEHVVKYVSLLETNEEFTNRRALTFHFTINKVTNVISYQLQYTKLSYGKNVCTYTP
jgi:exoribonuclease R